MQKAMVTFIEDKVRRTDLINAEFKKNLEKKIWNEVELNSTYSTRYINGNSIYIEHEGLSYDIFFDAWVSTLMVDWENFDYVISSIDIDNVECHVYDPVALTDEGFEREISIVLNYMDLLTLNR